MKQIGITGTMGSGKSFICSIFKEQFGIPVFDSDAEAKACYAEPEVRRAVRQAFGPEVALPDGSIDLKALSQQIFADASKLEKINRIVHPAVMRRYRAWVAQQENAPYTLFESAILYECGLTPLFDAVIRIECPEAVAVERVKARNGWDEESIRQRLRRQGGCDGITSDYTIRHDSSLPIAESRLKLWPQIAEIHRSIISMPAHNNPEQPAL